ncbi:hypothetical protein [Arthrobacter glacialis]|uniref:Uncharacterized protein n=1 Tax=Arthrobacter glacialis TaxID=1664 RepID=A0A2S3ZX87_ARTGL|nr:hypothetical protein [Arthrobacter glacialis]POH58978.1 hypothetical protein CVS28_09755 [Arthrobacter glacialis]POH73552.1 hypothetical protein CVS27_09225 [Arthrobacter glacialis]
MTFTIAAEQQTSPSQHSHHEHTWTVESAHTTSEGRVLYMVCPAPCGARRVDLRVVQGAPAAALSKETQPARAWK